MAELGVGVVIPAGGSGSRMAEPGRPAKQFREIGGAPILVHTVRAFNRSPDVGTVVVVAPASDVEAVRVHLGANATEAEVVAGGRTRQASVKNGLAALADGVDGVLVHDAVRPFVTRSVIADVVLSIREHGAAAAARPVADTLRRGGAGPLFGETVSREGLWAMQTPQGARLDWLRRAFALAGDQTFTDEVGLLQHAGYPVRIVEGDPRTFKITRPGDWDLAQSLWPEWQRDEGVL